MDLPNLGLRLEQTGCDYHSANGAFTLSESRKFNVTYIRRFEKTALRRLPVSARLRLYSRERSFCK